MNSLIDIIGSHKGSEPSRSITIDTELSETSENPVQNKAITKALGSKADLSEIPNLNRIEETSVLTVDGWIGDAAPYTQSINITGITSEMTPFIDLVISDDVETGKQEMTQWSYVTKATTSDNTITFACYENKPTIALNVKIKVV